jgi:NTP pyrophosphatase (non-canonical NTP hydrolase)
MNEMNPRYQPKTITQKLGYLAEESGEVLAAVGKTLRWGLDSWNPDVPESERETNRDWLIRELQDLKRAISIIEDELLPVSPRDTPKNLLADESKEGGA